MRKFAIALTAVALLATGTYPVSAEDPVHKSEDNYRQMLSGKNSAAPPASADSRSYATTDACVDDASGDTLNLFTGYPENYPKADITRFCATYGETIKLTTTPAQTSNPSTDPNWQNGLTGTLSDIDLNGDDRAEYHVFFGQPDGGGLVVEVTDPDLNPVCSGTPTYDGTSFIASFPRSCIGSPTSLRVDSFLIYDSQWDDGDAPYYADNTTFVAIAQSTQPPADPVSNPQPAQREKGRLSGPGRMETAARISQHAFPDGASEVYLARADNYPDALAGGALTQGPVLLVPQCAPIPQVVKDEIRRLDPAKVIALGGEGAVCEAVLDEALRS